MQKLITNPILSADFYKIGHYDMYDKGMNKLYSNLTCRNDKYASDLQQSGFYNKKVVMFGLQYIIKDFLINSFNENFFKKHKQEVISLYKQRVDSSLGDGVISTKHIEDLHDLGYLPLEIKAIAEGEQVNIGLPLITMTNTHPEFAWLVNYLETTLLNSIWKPITVATVAYEYRKILQHYADLTSSVPEMVEFCGHDFSMRGQNGAEDAMISGAAFLTSFKGTDSIPALQLLEAYYGVNPDIEAAGYSVRASEHSIMCSLILYNQKQLIKQGFIGDSLSEAEYLTFKGLLEKFPTGILSLVSDQYDYWGVIKNHLPRLKDLIMSRDGKLVLRPDSSDPVKIVCGYDKGEVRDAAKNELIENAELKYYVWDDRGFHSTYGITEQEYKGTIECLWELFGGTTNDKGFKELDAHIGLIYGDAITIPRTLQICEQLTKKGFATTNLIYGIGAYSLNGLLTRDTFGMAFKATYCEINNESVEIYKQPKTDLSKKSAKGLLRVEKINNDYVLHDCQTWEQEQQSELKTVFKDGILMQEFSLHEIRSNLLEGLKCNKASA